MAKGLQKDLPPIRQVEALLFSSGQTMSEEQLAQLTGIPAPALKEALTALQREYDQRGGAIAVFSDPTGWKMMVRDIYVGVVRRVVADTELSRACMETLAVIAYKYPKILQSEVIDMRGSGAYDHMSELERLGFIRREPEGRSYAVKLTERFFRYFDVQGEKDIRDVFKGVKVPKKAPQNQRTLGDLPVVDLPKHVKPGKLSNFEVVDVPPPAPVIEAVEEPTAPNEASDDFLSDLDARIAKLQERNNDHDKDPQLQRRELPSAEPPQDQ